MRIKVISAENLSTEKRWNIGLFVADNLKRATSGMPRVPIGEVVRERKNALNPQDFKSHVFNYIGLENVEANSGMLVNFTPVRGSQIMSRSKIFLPGDILYGRLRPNLNKVFLVGPNMSEGICSTEFYVLTPNPDKVLPYFLRYILSSDYVLEKVKVHISGAALPRIQLEDFLNIEIPLPSLEQQIILNEFLKKSDEEYKRAWFRYQNMPQIVLNELQTVLETNKIEPTLDESQFEYLESIWRNPFPVGIVSQKMHLF